MAKVFTANGQPLVDNTLQVIVVHRFDFIEIKRWSRPRGHVLKNATTSRFGG